MLAILGIGSELARAQCPEGWVPGQGVPGVDGAVHAILTLPDGEVIVGGRFQLVGSVQASNIAKFNPTTQTWSALGSGIGNYWDTVTSLALLQSGDVVAGGSFLSAGGRSVSNFARYRPGTETWIDPDIFFSGGLSGVDEFPVNTLLALPNGELMIGGSFTSAGGRFFNENSMPTKGLIRYDPTSGVASNLGNSPQLFKCFSLAIDANGDLVVGGAFNEAGGVPARSIARCNLATNTWTALGAGVSGGSTGGTVRAIASSPSGDLIVGGDFTTAGGVPCNRIARYSPASQWSPFGTGALVPVRVLVMIPGGGGDFLAGGDFGAIAGTAFTARIARYNASTGAWSPLGTGMVGTSVRSIAFLADGGYLAGGNFSLASGRIARNFARFDVGLAEWNGIGTGTDAQVTCSIMVPGGDVIVGGYFTSIGGVAANYVARFNPRTGVWSPLGRGTSAVVLSLNPMPNGEVLVGGPFFSAGGRPSRNAAIYNPVTGVWTSVAPMSDAARVTLPLPNGDVLVGGSFQSAGGLMPPGTENMAIYRPSTQEWIAIPGRPTGPVSALEFLPDGNVLVGGGFQAAGGTQSFGLATYNPVTGAWGRVGTPVNTSVGQIFVLPDGSVLATTGFSFFRYFPTAPEPNIVFYPQDVRVGELTKLPDGNFLVTRVTRGTSGRSESSITKVDINTLNDIGPSIEIAPGSVSTVTRLLNGDLFVGGDFLTAGGSVSAFYAKYSFGSPAPTVAMQPADSVVCASDGATLSAGLDEQTGDDAPVSYQWRRNAAPIDGGANPSALTPTLTLANLVGSDAASYDCVITTLCGSVTTNSASLTVVGGRCSPADVAYDDGATLDLCDPGSSNNGVTEGDYNLFFATFFDAGAACDIANDDGSPLPPFGVFDTNNGVTESDYNLFFGIFFDGCAL